MILSGRDLKWYIESGKLKVEPVTVDQFQQNGIDLILEDATQVSGMFYLGHTREVLGLPDDLMAFVEIRSTWARQGLFLPPTIVDAGFRGDLTLEILKVGPVAMPVGSRFAHLIFAKLTSPTSPYHGKYTDQRGITFAKADGLGDTT